MIKWLCVWYNLNNNTYYYKIIRNFNEDYFVGYINNYNHKLIIYDEIPFYVDKVSFNLKKTTIRKIISFLEKI